jgi:hypothetical protein
MTTGDLERIEKELKLVLPRSYREFMKSGKSGEGYGGTQDLTGVAEEVIEATKDLRAHGFYGASWRDYFLVIGDDGAGDYYFTDLQKERPAVFFADHELKTNKDHLAVSDKEQYQTFSELWEFIEKTNAATNLAIQRQQEQRSNKQWW